jgi:hypothetical protein
MSDAQDISDWQTCLHTKSLVETMHFATPGIVIKDPFFNQFKGLKSATGFPTPVGDMNHAFKNIHGGI